MRMQESIKYDKQKRCKALQISSLLVLSILTIMSSEGNGFWAGYYIGSKPFGQPYISRNDSVVNFEWGGLSPHKAIPRDNFSAIWSAWLTPPESGEYVFYTTSDDGVRLSIGGKTVIDNWTDHPPITDKISVRLEKGVPIELLLSYYENAGGAVIKLEWEGPGFSKMIIPSSAVRIRPIAPPYIARGSGLSAAYYPGINFSGTPIQRIDPQINFKWPGAPIENFSGDDFNVSWQGQIVPMYDGPTTLVFRTDDGVRVWLNDKLAIDSWSQNGEVELLSSIQAMAGIPIKVKIDYREQSNMAKIKLEWESVNFARQVIPSSQLIPANKMSMPAPSFGTGLTGNYYNNVSLVGKPTLIRRDTQVNFDWKYSPPMSGMPADKFSIKWEGFIQTRFDEQYTLIVTSDDGIRIWLDDKIILDKWAKRGVAEDIVTLEGKSGKKYKLAVEYCDSSGSAVAKLEWQSASEIRTLVPECVLYPSDLAVILPETSDVSPVFIEGLHSESVTLQTSIGHIDSYGSSRFGLNVPLSSNSSTNILLSTAQSQKSATITWLATEFKGEIRKILRPGDELLLKITEDGTLQKYFNCGVAPSSESNLVSKGSLRQIRFNDPGRYRIVHQALNGDLIGELFADVPNCEIQPMVACEVRYRRGISLKLSSAGDRELINMSAADEWVEVTNKVSGEANQGSIKLKPLKNKPSFLLARLGSSNGPVLRSTKILPFELESNSGSSIKCIKIYPDGTYLCEASLLMRPLIPGLSIHMHAFISGVTFEDSKIDKVVSSDQFSLLNNKSGFVLYKLLRAPGVHTGVCHSWVSYQDGVKVSP
jgi:PA14 domain